MGWKYKQKRNSNISVRYAGNYQNRLTYEYSNLIHEYSLNLNMKKTHLKSISHIYEDINSISLEDEEVLEEE